MAENNKRSFPMLPVAHWWALRKKFKQSIPGVVTDNYLATVLDMSVESARANVLPFLKTLRNVDDDGKPGERAKLWRDDGHYTEVCKAILKDVYPKDLIDAVPQPRESRDAAKRWFANHIGAGDSASSRMVALYTVLVEANPNDQPDNQKPTSQSKATKPIRPREAKAKRKSEPSSKVTQTVKSSIPLDPLRESSAQVPGISINLQIHISADASSDQIEQIFSAMAKHIYKNG